MIDTVVSVEMLVEEVMRIKKNRLAPDECTGVMVMSFADSLSVMK